MFISDDVAGLDRLFSAIRPETAHILDKALNGGEVTVEEGIHLFSLRGTELWALVATADELRRRTVGDVITYVQTRNITFTNVCYTGCRFCAFGKPRHDPDAYTFSLEEIVERAREAHSWGCTEVCLQGGLNPQLPATIYFDIVEAIKSAVPELHIHAFSPFEIQYGSARLGISHEELLRRLKDLGLGSIPGTAAEILDTDVRQRLTRNKLSAEAWVEIVTTAHRIGLPSTSTIMYGHIDTPAHWAHHLDLIRRIQRQTGGFTEFIPLGFIHERTLLYREDGARPGPTGMEDLKMHAVAA
ncbi:MAG: 5-amino-6-(D-ribitylamino)uracil--L-tyrosine 4-hydroxyphenyl transferase CofH [Ardenticatenia bacterium]|nr:5-amino-6-(D-ribitylamino)uracil--L-tyrosine 4-hydroxyphenyl transferase CofH [Ardenticatenia bacterium]